MIEDEVGRVPSLSKEEVIIQTTSLSHARCVMLSPAAVSSFLSCGLFHDLLLLLP